MGMNRIYRGIQDLPQEIPVLPLSGSLLLPRCDLPLNIFEPRYIEMIDAALAGDRMVGMIQPKIDALENRRPLLYSVGCAGRVTRFAETGNGHYFISLAGVCRFCVDHETTAHTEYRTCAVRFQPFADDLGAATGEEAIDRDAIFRALRAYALRNALEINWDAIGKTSGGTLVNALSMMSPFGPREKQALLEAADLKMRAELLVAMTEIELAANIQPDAPVN